MKEKFKNIQKLNFKDRRILVLTVISILTLITLVSTSFALFIKENETSQKDLFETGDLTINFNDETSRSITLNPAKPISDTYGKQLEPYTFTITNSGTYKSTYKITLVDSASVTTDATNLLKPVLKFQINDNVPKYLKDTDNQALISGTLLPGKSITYNLRLWIAKEATSEIEGLTYSGKIALSGKAVKFTKFSSAETGEVTLYNVQKDDTLKTFKVYGNTVEGVSVGDLITDSSNENNGKYVIPTIATGKNIANPEYIKTFTDNMIAATGNKNTSIVTDSEGRQMLRLFASSAYGFENYAELRKIFYDIFKENTQYTLSFDFYNSYGNSSQTAANLSVSYTDGTYATNNEIFLPQPSEANTVYHYTFTSKVNKTIKAIQLNYNNGSTYIYLDTLQIEEGTEKTEYKSYQEPVTYNIYLNEPLRSNGDVKDYIDFEQNKVIRWIDSDGSILSTPTEEEITLPQIKTLDGTTILSTNTTVKPILEGSY